MNDTNRTAAPQGESAPVESLGDRPRMVHRLELALGLIAYGMWTEEDRPTAMMEVAQAALDEYRAANALSSQPSNRGEG